MKKRWNLLCYRLADMTYALSVHRRWFIWLIVLLTALVTMNYANGEVKSRAELDWIDIAGEGLSVLMVMIWLMVILSIRAPGRTTSYFAAGIIGMIIALAQDFIDEFIRLQTYTIIGSIMEYMCFGLGLMTYAFWQWRQEQQALTRYLLLRQKMNNKNPLVTEGVRLPGVDYLHQALLQQVKAAISQKQPQRWRQTWLLVLDMQDSEQFVHERGSGEATRLNIALSELLLISVRPQDLVCHYAAQRYVVMLEDTSETVAVRLRQHLQQQLSQFSFCTSAGELAALQWQTKLVSGGEVRSPQKAVRQLIDTAMHFPHEPADSMPQYRWQHDQ
ncbi:hypothetical protein VA7868_02478 [Vibrio aerogenes CECT 7868]|uniref:GGDEF domain-containing protein n=1 Tax=Vibrio aerogenes CECT 7868 TaxID=1216006 RepID=A0A1M5ZA34_9VIBR|nr:diguanylate cyclase [Vibrio aerogenes]SHI21095.1 hypothetical protein VA7868_02478 [Vibrio aerogenes CECT 7868]